MTVSLRAMGCDLTLVAPEVSDDEERSLAARVAAVFDVAERRFSRFLPDSELSRLNRARGPMPVSEALYDVIARCQQHTRATGGLFDPAVGAALVALGYDRSFVPGALDREEGAAVVAGKTPSVCDAVLDPARRTVSLPPGLSLDFGGLVKGATVDEAMALLPGYAALSAGGDAALRGAGTAGDGWQVDVEDPRAPERVLATFRAWDVCVATSGSARRRWRVGAEDRHHLVDPRTGRSATSDLLQVTALAATTADAEVLAKCAFLLGAAEGRRFLSERKCLGAVLVDVSGAVSCVGALTDFSVEP